MPGFNPVNVASNYFSGRRNAQDEKYADTRNVLAEQSVRINEQTAQQDQARLSSEQRKQFATKMVQAAQYGIQSQAPKQFIEQNYPELAQLAGPSWQAATDDEVRQNLQDAIGKFGPEAGIGPAIPKTPEPFTLGPGQKRFGPDGNPIAAVDPLPRKGISMTMPDGTEVQIGGDGVPNYGGVGLTKPNQTKMQEAFINAQGNAYALREQMAKFKPEYSTMGGRLKAGIANLKEQAGWENAPQQTQFLKDFTSWRSDTSNLLSQYLNQLSGAAISPHEEKRLKDGFPNADDGPTQYKAKVEATMRRFSLVQARSAYLLSNPAQSLDSVSLDSMSSIITKEANRLADAYQRGGMDEATANERAIRETRTRFGMGE